MRLICILILFSFGINVSIIITPINATDNRYIIWENRKAGYIDSLGNVVITPQFDRGSDFIDGLATAEIGRIYYYYKSVSDTTSHVIIAQAESLDSLNNWHAVMEFYIHGKNGHIDTTGNFIYPPRFDDVGIFSGGLAAVNIGGQDYDEGAFGGGKWGFINKSGDEVIPLQYDDAKNFSGNLAAVDSAGKWGYINQYGDEVIPLQYDDATSFSENLAAVDSAGSWGYINDSGQQVFLFQFNIAEQFRYGFALCRYEKESDYFVIDPAGNRYDEGLLFYSDGYLIKMVHGKYGIFDSLGNTLFPPQFDYANPFIEGIASVKIGSKWAYIAHDGSFICNPQFDQAENFSGGMAAIRIGKDWGYIDSKGKITINPQFASAGLFIGALAQVGVKEKALFSIGNGKFIEGYKARGAYIDKSGKIVWLAKKAE